MKIDVRSKDSLYVELNGYIYYIDDSTNEQIIESENYNFYGIIYLTKFGYYIDKHYISKLKWHKVKENSKI